MILRAAKAVKAVPLRWWSWGWGQTGIGAVQKIGGAGCVLFGAGMLLCLFIPFKTCAAVCGATVGEFRIGQCLGRFVKNVLFVRVPEINVGVRLLCFLKHRRIARRHQYFRGAVGLGRGSHRRFGGN